MNSDLATVPQKGQDDGDRTGIVNLFLSVFKLQAGASPIAASEVVLVNPDAKGSNYIYELRVKKNKKWEARRMTIGLIGDEEPGRRRTSRRSGTRTRGHKSRCFKVTYDSLMVVKIPPTPIRSFREYLESINAEGRIAVKLAPRVAFVAPGVTAVLRKIQTLPDSRLLPLEELEKRYLEWLKRHPSFQEYLKVDGAFAFFMDLSRHAFLSQVIERLHDPDVLTARMREDILKSSNLLWDILEFEDKYGSENLSISFNMNKVYSTYDAQVAHLLRSYGLTPSTSAFQKQEWFLLHLAEQPVEDAGPNAPPEFIAELNHLLFTLMESNRKDVHAYRNAVREYVGKITFNQNKPTMAALIRYLLELLAWLWERRLSIRDLKPDNLFVVTRGTVPPGSPDTADPALGLIDFETAVDFDIEPEAEIKQPLLAGTPAYATPSHLFPNKLLEETLKDLPRTFHLQDWHATLAMIHTIVTGDCLFEHTRKLMFKTKRTIRKTTLENRPLSEGFIDSGRLFWNSATIEFADKLARESDRLKGVSVEIPEAFKASLSQFLMDEWRRSVEIIRGHITSQVVFNSQKNRRNLLQSSVEEINRLRRRWEKGGDLPKVSQEIRAQIIQLLKDLERLKVQAKQRWDWIQLLKRPGVKMSAQELMEAMFTVVLNTMYDVDAWGPLPGADIADIKAAARESDSEATIVFEETILYEATA